MMLLRNIEALARKSQALETGQGEQGSFAAPNMRTWLIWPM